MEMKKKKMTAKKMKKKKKKGWPQREVHRWRWEEERGAGYSTLPPTRTVHRPTETLASSRAATNDNKKTSQPPDNAS